MPDFNPFDMDFDGDVGGFDFLGFDYLMRSVFGGGNERGLAPSRTGYSATREGDESIDEHDEGPTCAAKRKDAKRVIGER
jgi:hypothetical protein